MSGKRRKPWIAQVTTGWTDDGHQIRKTVGTYETKREATEALQQFSLNPRRQTMSIAEAWAGWSAAFTGSKATIEAYKSAYRKIPQHISKMPIDDLNLDIMQRLVDTEPKTYSTAMNMKKTLAALLDYSFAHDACSASRSALLTYIVTPKRPATKVAERRWTDDEIQEVIDAQCVMAVILLFTGLRFSELTGLHPEDVSLTGQTISVRKSKTQAGIRTVPIPNRLVPWVKRWIDGQPFGRSKTYYGDHFWNTYPTHGHRHHDCRHTYISILTDAGIDERMVKALVGHAGGVTSDVYTHYKPELLLAEVNRAFAKYLPAIVDDEPDYTDRLGA